MNRSARKKLNLKAIQRYDSDIADILFQSSHSAVYHFLRDKSGWQKKNVEGVLFLVKRLQPPYFAIFILNRLNTDNYILYLNDFDRMYLQNNDKKDKNDTQEFLIYTMKTDERFAIWLYEEADRQRLLDRILILKKGVEQASKPQSSARSTSATDKNGNPIASKSHDLLTMLKWGTLQPPSGPFQPPNEYGPDRSESREQQLLNQLSPAIVSQSHDVPTSLPPPHPAANIVDFIVPDASLMQPPPPHHPHHHFHQHPQHHPHSPAPGTPPQHQAHTLLDLLQQGRPSPPPNVMQPTIPFPQQPQPQPAQSTDGRRLLDILKAGTPQPASASPKQHLLNMINGHVPVQNLQQKPSMPSPPIPAAALGIATPPPTHPPVSQPHQQRLFKELTKAYQPDHLGSSASPPPTSDTSKQLRSSALLLQTLQTGILPAVAGSQQHISSPVKKPNPPGYPETSSSSSSVVAQTGSPLLPSLLSSDPPVISSASPLLPEESIRFAQPEIIKRLASHQTLSKPEFIQQFINIIQSDPTFFDILYDQYQKQRRP
ncbi:hypothetical protein DM01DRAFT_1408604 [Hesseltinella vesiculosa]|uniref:PH domain-like protein n=1 Tax=Hesseltinella vesiculosa TaxID=101127 RepID=A0A1X2GE45_9FUNG|nr:hypothetical protein DM01DRAFT_1408604 [Hesseltinella vesiculosa]